MTVPNKTLIAAVTPTLQAITDEMGALEFAFTLEGQAAYTYAAALTLLQDPVYAAATATIPRSRKKIRKSRFMKSPSAGASARLRCCL